MNKIITLTAFGWGIILLSLFVYTDLMLPSVNQNSDYLMTFYTAGELVREGNTGALYPPLGSDTFIDTAFDKAAHNVLPLLPPRATAEYMYMPAVAGMFVPLSMVGPGISLLLWQVVCLASLAACTFLFSGKFKLGGSNENESSRLSTPAFWLALTLVPLAISIWIGQISVVFGLLPFMAGLFFVLRRKDLIGGLIWGMTIVKPQFLIPVLMLSVALASAKRFKPILGVFSGIAIFIAVNLAAFPTSLFAQWLSTLKLAEAVYSDLKFGVAQHIATSLPRAIILLLPVSQHGIAKPVIYTLSAILGGTGVYFCTRVLRSPMPESNKLALAAIVCLFATPIIVPHVFFYDYAMFVAAGFLAYSCQWSSDLDFRLKSLLWLGWLITNLYAVILFTNKSFAIPILFVLLMLELYRRSIVVASLAIKNGLPSQISSSEPA
ncbi:MAG TPA: glycosyltransferase family 87 protein [Drouetiella sp.]